MFGSALTSKHLTENDRNNVIPPPQKKKKKKKKKNPSNVMHESRVAEGAEDYVAKFTSLVRARD